MKAKVAPDTEQLRTYLQSAKHTLDTETAIEMTLVEIQGLLDYLDWIDAVNNSLVIVEPGGRIRMIGGKPCLSD